MVLRFVAPAAALILALVAYATLRDRAHTPTLVPVADGFDFPVGAPDGDGYYDAQPFGENDHLGSDWNGTGGGDSDLGDPVTAIAEGVVRFAGDLGGGWGNVVRIEHRVGVGSSKDAVESLYAHLDRIDVAVGARIRRGQRLGTIGTAHGRYKAHLHLELRSIIGADIGGGYASDRTGYLDPTVFIRAHRPR
jgi:murein DD-endopeptidase MepM/ murein hydrolase activator NlpD